MNSIGSGRTARDMSKSARVILVLVLICLCGLGVVCPAAGYLGYRAITSPRSQPPVGDLEPPGPSGEQGDRAGGTLRLSGGTPPTLDPAMVQDATSAEYVVHLFSGLVTLNHELEIVPDLASEWQISKDGRTYTFDLLPQATFQDGRPITAEGFVYSMERACDPATGSPVATSYLGDIVGVTEFASGRADHISGLRPSREHTLQIQIDAPKTYFLAKLTYPTAFLVDREQIEREGPAWLQEPNGSGPFVLESMTGDRIVLVRNERYYGELAPLERVEYLLSGGVPITMYENDRLDLVEVSYSEIERILDPHNPLNAEHRVTPELSIQYLGLSVDVPPFDDLAVRQAFAHAIDKEKLAELVLKGTAVPAQGVLPPGMPDHDETMQGLSYDPERALELLASSRYSGPAGLPQIVLTVSGTSGQMPPVTKAILRMIEDNLGVEMTVEQVDWAHFLRDLNDRRYQLFSTGWIADYPDSQNFLDILFHSESSQNHTGYRNPDVDRWLEEARVEADPARRTALYRQAEQVIVREASWIPLMHGVTHTLVKPHVKGFQSSASLHPWLGDIYIEE